MFISIDTIALPAAGVEPRAGLHTNTNQSEMNAETHEKVIN